MYCPQKKHLEYKLRKGLLRWGQLVRLNRLRERLYQNKCGKIEYMKQKWLITKSLGNHLYHLDSQTSSYDDNYIEEYGN